MAALRSTDVLAAVAAALAKRFGFDVHVGDHSEQEGIDLPCFFVQIIRTTEGQTKDFNYNHLSVIVDYIPKANVDKEIDFMDVADDCRALFAQGVSAGGRHLKMWEFQDERVGEHDDILEITVRTRFYDETGRDPDEGYELMHELKTRINQKYK